MVNTILSPFMVCMKNNFCIRIGYEILNANFVAKFYIIIFPRCTLPNCRMDLSWVAAPLKKDL